MNNKELLFSNSPEKYHSILKSILKDLEKNNIELLVLNDSVVRCGNFIFVGAFNSMEREIYLPIKRKFNSWFLTLIHEYCHSKQFIENKEWDLETSQAHYHIDLWLKGKEFSKEIINEAFKIIILSESDCEKRTYDFIIEFGLKELTENFDNFVRLRNTYAQSYQLVHKIRKVPSSNLYTDKEIWKLFPNKIHVGVIKLTEKQWEAFENE